MVNTGRNFICNCSLSFYLSLCISLYAYPSLFLSLSLLFFLYVSVSLSLTLCLSLSVCLPIYLSIYLSTYLFIDLSIYLSIYLSYLSIYLSLLILNTCRDSLTDLCNAVVLKSVSDQTANAKHDKSGCHKASSISQLLHVGVVEDILNRGQQQPPNREGRTNLEICPGEERRVVHIGDEKRRWERRIEMKSGKET